MTTFQIYRRQFGWLSWIRKKNVDTNCKLVAGINGLFADSLLEKEILKKKLWKKNASVKSKAAIF